MNWGDNWNDSVNRQNGQDDYLRLLSVVSPNHQSLSYQKQVKKIQEVWKLLAEYKKSDEERGREWEKNEKKRQEEAAKMIVRQETEKKRLTEKTSKIIVAELRKYVNKLSINGWEVNDEEDDVNFGINLKVSAGKRTKRYDITYKVPARPIEDSSPYLDNMEFRQNLSDKLFAMSHDIIKKNRNKGLSCEDEISKNVRSSIEEMLIEAVNKMQNQAQLWIKSDKIKNAKNRVQIRRIKNILRVSELDRGAFEKAFDDIETEKIVEE